MKIELPVSAETISKLKIYDTLELSGRIFTARDAALPKVVALAAEGRLPDMGIDLVGSAIFHTAVSPAGIGPTSSNKLEIEESIAPLSRLGVRVHIGKGRLASETEEALWESGAIFVVTPPTSALLSAAIRSSEVAAFPELGIEALHRLEVVRFPAIVAIANGASIFRKN